MFDVCESHMWISRCFNLIFTAIKTKKEKAGSGSNSRANLPRPANPTQHSDCSAASGIFFSPFGESKPGPQSLKHGPLQGLCKCVPCGEKRSAPKFDKKIKINKCFIKRLPNAAMRPPRRLLAAVSMMS